MASDNVEINIKAIVQGLDQVRWLVREIEKLPNAGDGIKGLSAQFASVQKDIAATVKELDRAGDELRQLGADTTRVMTQAGTATSKVPNQINQVGRASKSTTSNLAELSQTAASVGNALQQAFAGNVLGALQSLATALRASFDFTIFTQAATSVDTLTKSVDGSEKVLKRFSGLLGGAAKNAEGSLAKTLLNDFGIKAEQALLNPEIALQKFVSGLAQIPDAAERAIAVSNIFGASTAALLPSLEGMVAAEVAASAAADAFTAAQTTATTATAARVAADEALVVAQTQLAAAQATGAATAAEIAVLEARVATASTAAAAARTAETVATEALTVAETQLAAATTAATATTVTATTATIGLAGALTIAAGAILAVLAVAGAVIGIGYAITSSFSEAGSKLHDMAEETGLTAEELSVLKLAADGAGSSLDKVAGSFAKYLRNVNEAAGGNKEAASTMKQLGIDAVKANKDSGNALEQLFVALSKIPPGAQQVNAAMKVAGKSGADLIPVINQAGGSFEKFKARAEELGVVMSTDAANAADEFGDTMTDLSAAMEGIKNQIGAALLPTVLELAQAFLQFIIDNKQGFTDLASVIATTFKVAIAVFYAFGGTIAFLTNLVYGIVNAVYALVTAAFQLATGVISAGKALYQYLTGDVAGAVKTIEGAVRDAKFAIADLNQELTNSANIIATPTFTSLFKLFDGGDGSTPKTNAIPKPKPTGSFTGGGAGKKAKVDPEIKAYADAQLEFRKAQLAVQRQILEDNLKHEQEVLQANFSQNLESYEQYYTKLASIQKRSFQAQIDEVEGLIAIETEQRDNAKKGSERVKAESELLKLGAKLRDLKHSQYMVDILTTVEISKQARAYKDMITDIDSQLSELKGDTAAAANSRIEKELRDATEKAQAKIDAGDATGQGDLDRINKLREQLQLRAKYTEQEEQISILVAERDQIETALNQQVERGILTREQANAAQIEDEAELAAKIEEKLVGLRAYAEQINDPKLHAAVSAIELGLSKWNIDQTLRQTDDLKTRLESAGTALDLANQRIDTALKNGSITAAQADQQRKEAIATYSAAAEKLLAILQQIATVTNNTALQEYIDEARAGISDLQADGDELGQQLNQQFLGAFTDLFTSIADGTKSAKEAFADFGRSILKILADVAIKIILTKLLMAALGGGGSGGAGGWLSGLFGGDKAVNGFARGGHTGYGGVDEPAGVVHGQEFVVNADATAKNRAALEAMNEGLNPQRALSAGSNISPAATMQNAMANQNLQVVNVLPNDLLDNYVNSGNGTQTFLNMIENNATAINGRLKQGNG